MSKMIDAQGNTLVNVTESALPTGASTEAKQDTGNTSLASIDGKITAVNTGDVTVSASALPSGAATSAKQDAEATLVGAVTEAAPATDTASSGLNGRLQRIAQRLTSLIALLPSALVGGRLDVNIGAAPATLTVASHAVTNAGTFATQAAAAGVAAHGAAVSGNPILNGAEARTTNPTAVTSGQVARTIADKLGRLLSGGWAPRELRPTNAITLTSTTETTLLAAGGAGIFRDLTALILTNTSATGVRVDFRDATAGAVRFSVYVPPTDTRGVSLGGVAIPQTTANNNWTAQLSAAVTDVRIYAIGVEDR